MPPIKYAFGEPDGTEHAKEMLEMYMFGKQQAARMKAPVNPHDIARKDRQTVSDYLKHLDKQEPNIDQQEMIEKMEKKGIEKRIRRKIDEGSYSNFSVDEKKLFGYKDYILRYTWKGKLVKLRKYLKDKHTHIFINRQDYCGRTALHYAASWGCHQTLKLLLSVPGIKVNLQDADGKTAIRKACEIRSLTCVKMLVEAGANVTLNGADRRNPFEYVLQEQGDSNIELALYLYNLPQIRDHRKIVGQVTYLHQCCLAKRKCLALAEELIKCGAEINATEGMGRTPLMLATQVRNINNKFK